MKPKLTFCRFDCAYQTVVHGQVVLNDPHGLCLVLFHGVLLQKLKVR